MFIWDYRWYHKRYNSHNLSPNLTIVNSLVKYVIILDTLVILKYISTQVQG